MSGKAPEQMFEEWWAIATDGTPIPFIHDSVTRVVKDGFHAGLAAGEQRERARCINAVQDAVINPSGANSEGALTNSQDAWLHGVNDAQIAIISAIKE